MDTSATITTVYNPLKNEAMLAHAEFQMWDELYATHPDRVAIMNATAGVTFPPKADPVIVGGIQLA